MSTPKSLKKQLWNPHCDWVVKITKKSSSWKDLKSQHNNKFINVLLWNTIFDLHKSTMQYFLIVIFFRTHCIHCGFMEIKKTLSLIHRFTKSEFTEHNNRIFFGEQQQKIICKARCPFPAEACFCCWQVTHFIVHLLYLWSFCQLCIVKLLPLRHK